MYWDTPLAIKIWQAYNDTDEHTLHTTERETNTGNEHGKYRYYI